MLQAADFTGHWQVNRSITDRLARQTGRFTGIARFSAAGDGRLTYTETGHLQLGDGPAFEARRDYLWRFDADGVDVRFEDGRAFHRFRPEGHARGTDHPCGADHYRVVYDFSRWPLWSTEWTVTGPRKDYMMLSRMTRVLS